MGIRSTLLGVFSESPFKTIHDHMQASIASARLLNDLFQAVLDAQWDQARELQREISRLESVADQLQKQANQRLHRELFLPVSRYDVLSLVKSQDAIANQAEDIAGITVGRQLIFPDGLHREIRSFVASAVSVCEAAGKIVSRQELAMQSGFQGPCMEDITQMAASIHDLEHENDEQQIRLRHLLMVEESKLPPIDVMFMYKIFERIGNLADSAQHISEKFTLMLACS